MPSTKAAQDLQEFVEEVFETSKAIWAAQSRGKGVREVEISETEFLALDFLSQSQPLSVGEIQRRIGILPAQMSRVIRSLESKGEQPLVACKINPQDRRKIDVVLTEAGGSAHQAFRNLKLGSIERMLRVLGEQDRADLRRILRMIRESASNVIRAK